VARFLLHDRSMSKSLILASLVSASLVLVACEHQDPNTPSGPYPGVLANGPPPHQGGSTSAQAPNFDRGVVDTLSDARCDREEHCNNVGDGRKYATRQVCSDQMHGSLANDLNGYDCPRGIDKAALGVCLTAIHGEECAHPLDTIRRLAECRTGAMCIR